MIVMLMKYIDSMVINTIYYQEVPERTALDAPTAPERTALGAPTAPECTALGAPTAPVS